jgi:hypothetical protein
VWLVAGAGGQAQNIFTNIGTEFWSDGTSWQDAVTPAAGGCSKYTITFLRSRCLVEQ